MKGGIVVELRIAQSQAAAEPRPPVPPSSVTHYRTGSASVRAASAGGWRGGGGRGG